MSKNNLETGSTIHNEGNHYKIIKLVTQGPSVTTYLVEETNSKNTYLLKQLFRQTKEELEFYERMKQLKFINVVNIVDYFQNELRSGHHFLVTDNSNCIDLQNKLIKDKQILSIVELLEILLQVARGIYEIHNCGIIHGNIKPENVVAHEEYEGFFSKLVIYISGQKVKRITCRISDLDISKITMDNKYITGSSGTWYLAGSEQQKQENHSQRYKVDIFAFGVLIYSIANNQMVVNGNLILFYIFLIGNTLFETKNNLELINFSGKVDKMNNHVELVPLIKQMIERDAQKRPDIKQVFAKLLEIRQQQASEPSTIQLNELFGYDDKQQLKHTRDIENSETQKVQNKQRDIKIIKNQDNNKQNNNAIQVVYSKSLIKLQSNIPENEEKKDPLNPSTQMKKQGQIYIQSSTQKQIVQQQNNGIQQSSTQQDKVNSVENSYWQQKYLDSERERKRLNDQNIEMAKQIDSITQELKKQLEDEKNKIQIKDSLISEQCEQTSKERLKKERLEGENKKMLNEINEQKSEIQQLKGQIESDHEKWKQQNVKLLQLLEEEDSNITQRLIQNNNLRKEITVTLPVKNTN